MELYQKCSREASVVLVGTFFPLLLTPQWFIRNNLLPAEDADSQIGVEVIVKEITKFRMSSISVDVQEERVVFRSESKEFDYLIRDLAVGLVTFLPEANVTALGMNVVEQVEFLDTDFWHFIGDKFAPKEIWLEALGGSPHVGLKGLSLQVAKPDGVLGLYNLSFGLSPGSSKASIGFNDHYSLGCVTPSRKGDGKPQNDDDFNPLDILLNSWESTLEYQGLIVERMLSKLAEDFKDA